MSEEPKREEMFGCPNCDGMGEVRGPQYGMPYFLCRYCDGTGEVTRALAEDWGHQEP